MMMLRMLVFVSLIPFFLAGCVGTPPVDASTSDAQHVKRLQVKDEAHEVAELLADYRHLVALSVAHQQREYQDALADFERHTGEMQRLRLALLLTLPQVAWHDDARALQLLGSIVEVPAGKISPRRDLALILHRFVTERLRLVREEQRRVMDANQRVQGQLAERQRQLLDEQRKVEELERKLDALRRIDRKVLQRSTGR